MEFEEKPEVKELVQDDKLDHSIIENELAPALQSQFQEEPAQGPLPKQAPELDKKAPDPSALAAWVDDISDYGDAHQGDVKASELLDKLASGALDDEQGAARAHLKEDVTADIEQKGMVMDFHADSALEGAALDTPSPEQKEEQKVDDDGMPLRARRTGLGDDDDDDDEEFGGGDGPPGGLGGSGAGQPGDDPRKAKNEKADDKKPDDKKPDKAKPDDKKPEAKQPAKPADKKPDDKKRDGDR